MSKTLFTAAVLLIGLGHGALAAGPELLGCRGPFAKDASAATLVAAFGAANVAHEDLDVGEGFTEPGTVIFKSDGKRRIEVFWHDSETRSRPSRIIVHEPSAWRVALPGDSTASLGIGTELATVEAANRKPFTLNGFGWDGAGYVGEWSGGRLTKLDGGCSLSLRFGPSPQARPAALAKVSGDKPFASNAPGMRAVKPRIEQISLGWPQ